MCCVFQLHHAPSRSKLLEPTACLLSLLIVQFQNDTEKAERDQYSKLIETVGWFFFDLFILGYVEDPPTGWSFRFPGGMQLAVYVEVIIYRA